MTALSAPPASWWQPHSLEIGECRNYRIGPVDIYLQREQQQWLVATEIHRGDDLAPLLQQTVPMIPLHLKAERYMFNDSPAHYRLQPVLLDRPVVVKTLQPVHIPPAEHTTFFISSPVCIRLSLQQPEVLLLDIAVQRLSDTWFGPSTQVGELCYADKTHARHSKLELPLRPHRAITPVTIQNHSTEILTIDKISIPVPFLSVYGMPDGNLWTDAVSIQHESLQALAHFKIEKRSAAETAAAIVLSHARKAPEKHSLIRAFADIFSD